MEQSSATIVQTERRVQISLRPLSLRCVSPCEGDLFVACGEVTKIIVFRFPLSVIACRKLSERVEALGALTLLRRLFLLAARHCANKFALCSRSAASVRVVRGSREFRDD